MRLLLDHLIHALQAHAADDVPNAAEHYSEAIKLGINNHDLDVQIILAFCRRFMSSYYNDNHAWAENGEFALLDRLAALRPRTVFDVGAQQGFWSEHACGALPEATVHAFEILPETADRLVERIGGLRNLVFNRFGLFDRNDEVTVRYTRHSRYDYLSSIVSPQKDLDQTKLCPVRTGDDYMASAGVPHIDFLKIDVEGAEISVMKGFSNALSSGAIDMIQFEYGKIAIHTKVLLTDYYEFLEPFGYKIGRLYPNGIFFKDYSRDDENFLGSNYIAVRGARSDLIEALRQTP